VLSITKAATAEGTAAGILGAVLRCKRLASSASGCRIVHCIVGEQDSESSGIFRHDFAILEPLFLAMTDIKSGGHNLEVRLQRRTQSGGLVKPVSLACATTNGAPAGLEWTDRPEGLTHLKPLGPLVHKRHEGRDFFADGDGDGELSAAVELLPDSTFHSCSQRRMGRHIGYRGRCI
jgi:hypothetical protein